MSATYFNDLESQNTTTTTSCTTLLCNRYNALTQFLGRSKFLTTIFILVPMIFMFTLLMYIEYSIQNIYFQGVQYDFQEYRSLLLYPIIAIASITFISGSVSLVSVYTGFYNLIRFGSFIYSAIGYWIFINTVIIAFCTWEYLNHNVIGYMFLWSSIASIVWLFSSAVMDTYRINCLSS